MIASTLRGKATAIRFIPNGPGELGSISVLSEGGHGICLSKTLGAGAVRHMAWYAPEGDTMKEAHQKQGEGRAVIRSIAGGLALVLAASLYPARSASSEEIEDARKHPEISVAFAFSEALKREVETLNDFDDGDFDPKYGKNISGLVFTKAYLLIGADEGATVLILKRHDPSTFNYTGEIDGIIQLEQKSDEIDIEGVARGKNYVYVIGSHSRKRLEVKNDRDDDETVQDNLNRLAQTAIEPSRERLYRLKINPDGTLSD
jgi:hypothetical protein